METAWVENENKQCYSGCLVIFNVTQENISDIDADYKKLLAESIDKAHANGDCVVYATGYSSDSHPDEFDWLASMDYMEAIVDVTGFGENFNSDAKARMEEYIEVAQNMSEYYNLVNEKVSIAGMVLIDGTMTTIDPIVEISL